MKTTFRWDVFLSYAHPDLARVQEIAKRLCQVPLKVWFDEWVITAGAEIPAEIELGLAYSRTLVLCMSPAAFGSRWVDMERRTATFRDPTNARCRFIPVLLQDCEIPQTIRRFRYVDLREEDDLQFQKLVEACQMAKARGSRPSNSGLLAARVGHGTYYAAPSGPPFGLTT